MIIVPFLAEWDKVFGKLGGLVELYEKQDFSFARMCGEFMEDLERLAENQRLPLANDLALLRGEMLGAGREKPAAGEGTSAGRKKKERQIFEILIKTKQTVDEYLQKDRASAEEAKGLLRQAASVVVTKKMLSSGGADQLSVDEALHDMYQDKELVPVITMVIGKTGRINARLFAELLTDQLLRYFFLCWEKSKQQKQSVVISNVAVDLLRFNSRKQNQS